MVLLKCMYLLWVKRTVAPKVVWSRVATVPTLFEFPAWLDPIMVDPGRWHIYFIGTIIQNESILISCLTFNLIIVSQG